MPAPEARIRVGDCDLLLLGTIAGFVPDAARVEEAFAAFKPDRVALGVPPEDLATLRRLHREPAAASELPETDPSTERLFGLLARFGQTQVPSPDLEAVHRLAHDAGVPLAAIDLDDAAHAEAFTELVKVRHIIRSNRHEKRMLEETFGDAPDAYALALAWDAAQTKVKPLARIEAMRERHMAVRLRELAARSARLLAVLPAARLPGIVAALGEG